PPPYVSIIFCYVIQAIAEIPLPPTRVGGGNGGIVVGNAFVVGGLVVRFGLVVATNQSFTTNPILTTNLPPTHHQPTVVRDVSSGQILATIFVAVCCHHQP
ncbi:MAG: hypothetical protein LUD39_03755, partial [Opitutae bacterium]|nr:hypothetical protein [Opitutae bacterium]MCD8298856.1 hypothetical protein [Opitutae bacterium]